MSVSTVSATGIQDPSGQVFANGTWRLEFVPTYGTPGIYNDGGLPFTKQYGGSLDATGSFSQAGVNRNDTIAPAGSQWRFTAIPAVNGTTYSVLLNVNSPAFDVTAAINTVITNIVVSPTSISRAYKDSELVNVDGSGAIYYDETLKVLKVWDAVTSSFLPITPNAGSPTFNNLTVTGQALVKNFENIRFADQFATGSSTGGLQEAINDLPTAGGTILIPSNYSITIAAGLSVNVSKNVVIEGHGWSSKITSASGQQIFNLTSSVSQQFIQFNLKYLDLEGGGGASSVIGNTNGLGPFQASNFQAGEITVEHCLIHGFGAIPFNITNDTYFARIHNNVFDTNVGAFANVANADSYFEENYVLNQQAGAPALTISAANTTIRSNTFIRGSVGSLVTTEPDIQIKPVDTNVSVGPVVISGNRMTLEGDVATRPKILISGSTNTWEASGINIRDNWLWMVTNQTAISFTNVATNVIIDANQFYLNGAGITLVNDAAPVPLGVNSDAGQSIFGQNNRIFHVTGQQTFNVFTNGGRGFKTAYVPSTSSDVPFNDVPRDNETPEIRNRIPFSVTLNGNWGASGVTIADGQTDPWGGTTGSLFTRANAAAGEQVNTSITMTGAGSRLYVKLWAKNGTAGSFQMGVYDNTANGFATELLTYNLGTNFKQYKTVINGINPAHSFQLYIYPVNSGVQSAGTMTIAGAQVSDYDGDYTPTTGAMVVDTASGNRWNRRIRLGSGIAQLEEQAAPSGAAGSDFLYADSTAHRLKMNNNNGGADPIVGAATTDTLTNKRITKRSVAQADATSITVNSDITDIATQVNTQVAGTLTLNAPTGTPTDGQPLLIRIKSTNAQTYSFNAAFRFSTTTVAPTGITAGKVDLLAFVWNSTDNKWDVAGVNQGH